MILKKDSKQPISHKRNKKGNENTLRYKAFLFILRHDLIAQTGLKLSWLSLPRAGMEPLYLVQYILWIIIILLFTTPQKLFCLCMQKCGPSEQKTPISNPPRTLGTTVFPFTSLSLWVQLLYSPWVTEILSSSLIFHINFSRHCEFSYQLVPVGKSKWRVL